MSDKRISLAMFASMAAVLSMRRDDVPSFQPGDPVGDGIDRMRERVSHEPGGVLGPVRRDREQARRLRQKARAAARQAEREGLEKHGIPDDGHEGGSR